MINEEISSMSEDSFTDEEIELNCFKVNSGEG